MANITNRGGQRVSHGKMKFKSSNPAKEEDVPTCDVKIGQADKELECGNLKCVVVL